MAEECDNVNHYARPENWLDNSAHSAIIIIMLTMIEWIARYMGDERLHFYMNLVGIMRGLVLIWHNYPTSCRLVVPASR